MFEAVRNVVFPGTAVAGDSEYVPFNLPDGEREIEIAAWGNYPAYKGVYLFPDRTNPTTVSGQLSGETALDVLLTVGSQIISSCRLPDNVRGCTVYLEQALGGGGALVVTIRLRERSW